MGKKISIIVFFIIELSLNAQIIKKFSPDSAQFNEEINTFFRNIAMPEDIKPEIEKFLFFWNSKSFNENEYVRINNALNMLFKFNTRPYPDFTGYLKTVTSFAENNKDSVLLRRWNESVLFLLSNEKTKVSTINNYFDFTYELISDRYIYNSRALSWKMSNDNYQFHVEGDIYLKLENTTLICYAKNDSV